MTKKLLSALAAGLTFAATTTPASAGEVTISINLEGIDLSNAQGLELAQERIERSVTRACRRSSLWQRPLLALEAKEECIADGTSKALAQLQSYVTVAEAEAEAKSTVS